MIFKMNIKLFTCLIAFSSLSVFAGDLKSSKNTKDFCALANELGYKTRGYKASSGGCATDMVEISPPGKNGLGNNLAYYATGESADPSKLDYVSFILNVNNTSKKKNSYEELYRVSSKVGESIFGKLPSDFKIIIINGKSKSWKENDWEIKVNTSIWPTGLGQDTRIIFEPIK